MVELYNTGIFTVKQLRELIFICRAKYSKKIAIYSILESPINHFCDIIDNANSEDTENIFQYIQDWYINYDAAKVSGPVDINTKDYNRLNNLPSVFKMFGIKGLLSFIVDQYTPFIKHDMNSNEPIDEDNIFMKYHIEEKESTTVPIIKEDTSVQEENTIKDSVEEESIEVATEEEEVQTEEEFTPCADDEIIKETPLQFLSIDPDYAFLTDDPIKVQLLINRDKWAQFSDICNLQGENPHHMLRLMINLFVKESKK